MASPREGCKKNANPPQSNHIRRVLKSSARLSLYHPQELTTTSEHFNLSNSCEEVKRNKTYLVFKSGGNNNTFVLKQANSNGSMDAFRHMLPEIWCTKTHSHRWNCSASCRPRNTEITFLPQYSDYCTGLTTWQADPGFLLTASFFSTIVRVSHN